MKKGWILVVIVLAIVAIRGCGERCEYCCGKGSVRCVVCDGYGRMYQSGPTCPVCDGSGASPCPACHGSGKESARKF